MTNKQDWHVCELSQQGIASRAYQPGPYSARESLPAAWTEEHLALSVKLRNAVSLLVIPIRQRTERDLAVAIRFLTQWTRLLQLARSSRASPIGMTLSTPAIAPTMKKGFGADRHQVGKGSIG